MKATTDTTSEEQVEEINNKLLELNPAQQSIQIDAINILLKGSTTLIDIKLPKTAQKTRGRPKGAPKKPQTTKRNPSGFEILDKKRKAEDKKRREEKEIKNNRRGSTSSEDLYQK